MTLPLTIPVRVGDDGKLTLSCDLGPQAAGANVVVRVEPRDRKLTQDEFLQHLRAIAGGAPEFPSLERIRATLLDDDHDASGKGMPS
jgi:hypothetical protein